MKKLLRFFSVIYVSIYALPAFAFSLSIENPLHAPDLPTLIENITGALVKIGIPFAVAVLIWGGFRFITATAQGNEMKLKQARELLGWTIIGSAIVIGSWALVYAAVNFAKTLG